MRKPRRNRYRPLTSYELRDLRSLGIQVIEDVREQKVQLVFPAHTPRYIITNSILQVSGKNRVANFGYMEWPDTRLQVEILF